MTAPAPPFTCPRCGRTSWNEHDAEAGYCGACHWWTGDPLLGSFAATAAVEREIEAVPLRPGGRDAPRP